MEFEDDYDDDSEDTEEDKFGDNPADFYFQMCLAGTVKDDDSGMDYFLVCPKSYFDNYGYLFDDDLPSLESKIDAHGFYRLMEGTFEFVPNWKGDPNFVPGNPQQGRNLLLSLGFIEKKMV